MTKSKTTEFNLSKKICEDADMCYPAHVVMVDDVKEFIRLLKIELDTNYGVHVGRDFKLFIDKLAGDKLK